MHREELSGLSIELLQVRAPPINDAKTVSENRLCKPTDGQNLVPTIQLGPENHLQSVQVLTTESLPHHAVMNTVTLIYTQVLVDLTWFQTVDGVRFPTVTPELCPDSLPLTKCATAHLSRPNFIWMSSEKVRTVCNNPSN